MRIKNSETLYKDYYRKVGFPLKNGYYSIEHQKKKKIYYCLQLNR